MSDDRPIEPWRLVGSRYAYSDRWLKLRSDTVTLPGGKTLSPYHVIEAADWVNVVAISEAGNVVLVEQYRHAVRHTMLEIPAGHVDPQEQPEAAVRRELLEETGYGGGSWHFIGSLHPAASRFDNQVHSFAAIGVRRLAEPRRDSSEDMRVREIPWTEFAAQLRAGSLRLREANQMSTVFLLHLKACEGSEPVLSPYRL